MDTCAETDRIIEVEQVDSSEDLSDKSVDILCQPEDTQEVFVDKKLTHIEQVFKSEDSLRKKCLPFNETVTKEEIPEIKAEPVIQAIHLETKKESETSGVVKEVQNLPHLVLKSDLSLTKPESVDKVAPKEAVYMRKIIPNENDINLKKEVKMPEKGTNTYTCAFFGISTFFMHFIQSVLCLVLQCLPSRQAKLSCILLFICSHTVQIFHSLLMIF